MVSKTLPKIPTINLTSDNAKPGSSSWISTAESIRQALEDYGCFVAIYDKLPLDLHNKVFDVIQPMFELPSEVKATNTSNLPYHGYYKPGPVMPLLESFGVEDPAIFDNTSSFTHLLWPHGNEEFCEAVHVYAKKTIDLENMVTRMMFKSYGAQKYLDSHFDSATYLLRIAKYRVPQKEEGTLGGVAHTDKNFLTILHQNDVDGLEVRTKDGHWISYESSPNSFVVMAGELLLVGMEQQQNIHTPFHRVIMESKKPRYSIALFSRSKSTIETPKELVDEEHPLLFKPFDYMGLINFYTEDVTRMSFCTIKDYCGV